MAAGLVVVGAAIGGIKEAINDGEDGFYFSPGDVNELIQKIELIYNSTELFSRISKKAVQKVAKHFDINKTVDEIEVFLTKVKSDLV